MCRTAVAMTGLLAFAAGGARADTLPEPSCQTRAPTIARQKPLKPSSNPTIE